MSDAEHSAAAPRPLFIDNRLPYTPCDPTESEFILRRVTQELRSWSAGSGTTATSCMPRRSSSGVPSAESLRDGRPRACGPADDLELVLDHHQDPLVARVEKWFVFLWCDAVSFDLAEIPPYLVYAGAAEPQPDMRPADSRPTSG